MADSKLIIAATIPEDGAAVYAAPLGTALPTDASAELDPKFIDLGWISQDGVTNGMSRQVTKHKAWSGETVKVTQDSYEETIKLALLETSAATLGVVFGEDNVTGTGDKITVNHSSLMLARQVFVIDFIDGDRLGRILVREGQVTEIDDIKYVHSDLTMYSITVDVFKPETGETGVTVFYDKAAAGGTFSAPAKPAKVDA